MLKLAKPVLFSCENEILDYQCHFCHFTTNEKTFISSHTCGNEINRNGVMLKHCQKCKIDSFSVFWYCKCNVNVRRKLYECDQCDFKSKRKSAVAQHKNNRHISNELIRCFQCDQCSARYTAAQDLHIHKLNNHGSSEVQKWYNCDKCNYKSIDHFEFQCHSKSHFENFESPHWFLETKIEDDLKAHISNKHTVDNLIKWYQCHFCGYRSRQRERLELHRVVKHCKEEKKFKCDQCAYSSHYEGHVKNHRAQKHLSAGETELYSCLSCDYKNVFKASLKAHILLKHSSGDKEFKCNRCIYASYRLGDLNRHIRLVHEKLKCDQCRYRTYSKESLQLHKIHTHVPVDQSNQHSCTQCDFTTTYKSILETHILVKHNDKSDKKFKCDECNYVSHRQFNLKTHMIRKHSTGAKLYNCVQCNFSTHASDYLRKHQIRMHLSEGHECTECNYRSKDRSALKTHILTEHTNVEKEFKCSDCSYETHIKRYFIAHQHVHSKIEKNYMCDQCTYVTHTAYKLKSHQINKHLSEDQITFYNCPDCNYRCKQHPDLKRHLRLKHPIKNV